jgi:hypothetical protein
MVGAARTLSQEVAPALAADPYARGHVGTIALLLTLMAQEAERAAQSTLWEIDAMRSLFEEAAHLELPHALVSDLAAGAKAAPEGLHVRTLETHAASLKALLIRLHEAAEAEPAAWARALERRIWGLLNAAAQARSLHLPAL